MDIFNDILTNQNKERVERQGQEIFWYQMPSILWERSRLAEFYPSYDMSLSEKLNAIMRLGIYIGLVLFLVMNNYNYLWIPVMIGVFTVFIYKSQKANVETFFNNYRADYDGVDMGNTVQSMESAEQVKPTVDNPFMNFNQITDSRFRAPAQKSYNNDYLKADIEDKFNAGLYRDVDDIWSKSHGQRQFYTMPNTKAVSDQTSFAKWLYNSPPTLKEDTIKGAPHWNPVDYLEPDSTC